MTGSRSLQLVENVLEPPDSRVVDLAPLRPNDHDLTHNRLTPNRLPLCPPKVQNLAPLRPCTVGSCLTVPRNLHPTCDADPSSLRHRRPFQSRNPLTMGRLLLYAKKCQNIGLLRHSFARPFLLSFSPSNPSSPSMYNTYKNADSEPVTLSRLFRQDIKGCL
jgi:hypothetical protein